MKKLLLLYLVFGLTFIAFTVNTDINAQAGNLPEKTVCLTFDDGPTKVTEKILDCLAQNNIKATFFVCGKNVEKNPKILSRIFKEGHSVGIHTHTHDYKSIYASPKALTDDINACLRAIKAVNANYKPLLYRFPGGSFNLSDSLISVPKNLGLCAVDWNASCRDCELKTDDSSLLFKEAMSTSANKSRVILLMHDAADKHLTALALPDIIKEFTKNGFSFLTVEKVVKIS